MTAPPMLMLRDLAISAAGRAITTGTSLDIARGETIAIVGESGSGKSLTAKAIARLLPPGARLTHDGIDLLGRSRDAADADAACRYAAGPVHHAEPAG
jgi:ABC-type glutathione transport system ATPase component